MEDKNKRPESLLRYGIYMLCGAALLALTLPRLSEMNALKYVYLALGAFWLIWGGAKAVRLWRRRGDK